MVCAGCGFVDGIVKSLGTSVRHYMYIILGIVTCAEVTFTT